MAKRRQGEASAESHVPIGGGAAVTTQEAAPAATTVAQAPLPPEPLPGPKLSRQHRADYHIKVGVSHLLHLARQGKTKELEELATKQLRDAYGIGS